MSAGIVTSIRDDQRVTGGAADSRRDELERSTTGAAAQTAASDLERLTPTLGLKEAAKLLHCHPDSARKMAAAGKIPATKVGRTWVFHTESLLEWLEARCKASCVRADPMSGSSLAESLRAARLERMRKRPEGKPEKSRA